MRPPPDPRSRLGSRALLVRSRGFVGAQPVERVAHLVRLVGVRDRAGRDERLAHRGPAEVRERRDSDRRLVPSDLAQHVEAALPVVEVDVVVLTVPRRPSNYATRKGMTSAPCRRPSR